VCVVSDAVSSRVLMYAVSRLASVLARPLHLATQSTRLDSSRAYIADVDFALGSSISSAAMDYAGQALCEKIYQGIILATGVRARAHTARNEEDQREAQREQYEQV
jgi:hypothetical protein